MPPERTQRTPRKLDRAKTVELAQQGMSTADIAQHQGVVPSTVFRFLQQTKPEQAALGRFKKDRGDVFARLAAKSLDLQERILDTYDERLVAALKPHEKGSLLHALNIQAGTLYDKERLERGQSTSNLSVLAKLITEAEAGLCKEIKATEPVP